MTDDECGFAWKDHECTGDPGHPGRHTCTVHYSRCCNDCTEEWTDPCDAVHDREVTP